LKPNAVALYTAALAWEQANQNERAADDYARAVSMPASNLQPQQVTTANDRLAALEKVLGTLAVTGPDGTRVQMDQFSEVAVPARLHGTGGTHAVAVKIPNKPNDKREVLLEGGQVQKLDVTPVVEAPKHEETVAPPPKQVVVEKPVSHMSVLKAVGFSAIGASVIGGLGAIMLGVLAQNAGDAYTHASPLAGEQALHDQYTNANALATWTTVAWISAGVLLAAGVTLVLIPESSPAPKAAPPKDEKKPAPEENARLTLTPSVGGLLLRGSF
jgi:hypothetical protein